MGTRSSYRVIERSTENNRTSDVCLIYFQFDGYPEGHPLDVARFLSSGEVVNGIPSGVSGMMFNGAGCLAAQIVAKFKNGPGDVYIEPMDRRGNMGEEYLYDIIVTDYKNIEFVAMDGKEKAFFSGSPEEFVEAYG